MKTKEEIIKAAIEPLKPTYNLTIADCQQIVFPAMDRYAKQEAKGFYNWIMKEGVKRDGGGYYKMEQADQILSSSPYIRKDIVQTTDELYNLYKQSVKQ